MKILKKILAFAIILGMFGQTSINGFASNNYKLENIKYNISNSTVDKKIKDKVDSFIEKIDEKKLDKLSDKINTLKLSGKIKTGTKIDLIINYIDLKIQEKKLLKAEIEKKAIFNKKLSEVDNKKVNTELVKIQKNILNIGTYNLEKLIGEFEKYTNIEENGNFKTSLKIDNKLAGKIDAEIKLSDYNSKQSGFDAQFKSKVEAFINATKSGEEKEIKVKFSGLIDYISKDQNYYLLLKNLKIVNNEGIENFQSFIEKAKEIASKNKYIKIEDKNSQKFIKILKQFEPKNIISQGNKIVSKPLFRAYKKEGNKYYLVPSKYGCDTAKVLAKKFDPFNGNTCSDSQYQDLLSDIADSKVEFYIDFSNSNTIIGFDANNYDKNIEKNNGSIVFSTNNIEEINYEIKPNQEKYPLEGASFNYKRNNYLNSKFYAKKGKINYNLKSKLNKYNNFSSIDFTGKTEKVFNAELKLTNRKITGKYDLTEYNDKLVGIISGKTSSRGQLTNIKISNQYIKSGKYSPFENLSTFEYNNGEIKFNNKYSSKGTKSDLNISGKSKYGVLTEGKLNLLVEEKKYSYDENYDRVYTGNFEKIFESNIELKNKILSGKTVAYKENKEIFNIVHKGKIEKQFFELNNKVILGDDSVKFYNMVYGTSDKKIIGDLNMKFDTRSNKNNGNLYIDLIVGDKKVIEFEIDNQSTKIYKKVKILAPLPNDTIELEDAFKNDTLY